MNDEDKNQIKIDLKWFDDLLANTNGTTQFDLFTNDSGSTITTAVGGTGSTKSWGPSLTNGTGGYIFQSPPISNGGTGTTFPNISIGGTWDTSWGTRDTGLKVNGDAEFEGDVKIKGKSITDMFEKIEEKLAILHPNEELEAKWEKLRELRKQYIELEKEILEKEKMWNILKK